MAPKSPPHFIPLSTQSVRGGDNLTCMPPMPCQVARDSAPSGLLGAFIPECKEDGSYKEKQCHGSTGHCWCVDQSGKEIDGSRKSASEGEPKCVGK